MIKNHEHELRSDPHYQESFWINFDMILDEGVGYLWSYEELKAIKFITKTRIKWSIQLDQNLSDYKKDLISKISKLKVAKSKTNKNYFLYKQITNQYQQLLDLFLKAEKKQEEEAKQEQEQIKKEEEEMEEQE